MAEDIQQNKNSFGKTVLSAAAFPAVMQGVNGLKACKQAGGVKNAVSDLELEAFKKLNTQLKTANKDIFSRSTVLADNYEQYKEAYKNAKKLAKNVKKGKAGLFSKMSSEELQQASKEATDKLNDIRKTLKNGEQISKTTAKTAGEVIEQGTKAGFKKTAKTLFKKEMTSKFNLGISVLTTFVPAFTEKVVPAFKEKGIIQGFKELAKATAQTASDFVSYGLGGALGRTIGMAVGSVVLPGVGSAVGGAVGDAVGSILVGGKICEKVDEVIGSKKENNENEASNQQFEIEA